MEITLIFQLVIISIIHCEMFEVNKNFSSPPQV